MKPTAKLNVGLLLCDDVDPVDHARYGTYPEMFNRGIHAVDENITLVPVRCYQGEMPDSPDDFDAFLISGSRQGVYESLPWIAQLQEFVRRCQHHRKKTVGICFGHQLIAHALGGEARKMNGWGIGVHRTRITEPQAWMGTDQPSGEARAPDAYNLIVIHQDQVVALPAGFRTIAENDFCPISMYVDDNVMLGIQGHPEFNKEFCAFRIHARRELLGNKQVEQSLASLEQMDLDSARVLGWVARFIRA